MKKKKWVDKVVDAIKTAPGSPYGQDNETIAAAILEKIR
jgi:hypothetical protein